MFHRGFQTIETIKALGLRPRAFICFLVFGNPDETLPLIFEILRKTLSLAQWIAFEDGVIVINEGNDNTDNATCIMNK